jgi:flagellin-like hook-associated protein FlgL
MTIVPTNIARVPNLLASQIALSNVTRTHIGLFRAQSQLSTGLAVHRPSDDAVKAATILTLDDRLNRAEQRLRNMDHAASALDMLDHALGEASGLMLEAKTIASNQVNFGASPDERAAQAQVIDSLLASMLRVANTRSNVGHAFGASAPAIAPVQEFLGGYRYVGHGPGLLTDLGRGSQVPLTLAGDNPIARTSARVRGTTELVPELDGDMRLAELRGGRGMGVSPGVIEFSFSGGPTGTIDLRHADTLGNVRDAVEAAIRAYESEHGLTVLGNEGVRIGQSALIIDVQTGPQGEPDPELTFADPLGGSTAQDLGLAGGLAPASFSGGPVQGSDLRPMLTWRTRVDEIDGLPLGELKITNAGQSRVVDLSQAQTYGDIRDLIKAAGLGVRLEIDESGQRLNLVNEVAAGRAGAMSVEEVPGSDATATRLGIRSYSGQTPISAFNFGKGVQVLSGGADPDSGLPNPDLDVDFRITLGDGRTIDVDLRPQDITTVAAVIARINEQAQDQGINVPGQFEAALSDGSNGIMLVQADQTGGPLQVQRRNGSPAAEQLGLAGGTHLGDGNVLVAEDRARVRVPGVFSDLLDLSRSLRENDTFGITFAGEMLETTVEEVAQVRGLVGGYARRVEQTARREEDRMLIDTRVRSELRDLDYTEAAVRLSMLQTQLQAGLQMIAASASRSLLDFLG